MRGFAILVTAAAVAGCSTAPQAPSYNARGEQQLQQLLAGKTAGAPQACLNTFRSDSMFVVDDDTIAFRDGSNRAYVNNVGPGCSQMDAPGATLVFRNLSGSGPCRGDIAEVTYLSSGTTVGSCVMGDFVPYTRP